MAKEIKYGAEARNALQNGVNQLADTVRALCHRAWFLSSPFRSSVYLN